MINTVVVVIGLLVNSFLAFQAGHMAGRGAVYEELWSQIQILEGEDETD